MSMFNFHNESHQIIFDNRTITSPLIQTTHFFALTYNHKERNGYLASIYYSVIDYSLSYIYFFQYLVLPVSFFFFSSSLTDLTSLFLLCHLVAAACHLSYPLVEGISRAQHRASIPSYTRVSLDYWAQDRSILSWKVEFLRWNPPIENA